MRAAALTPHIPTCPSLPSIGCLAKAEKGQQKTKWLLGTFAPNPQLCPGHPKMEQRQMSLAISEEQFDGHIFASAREIFWVCLLWAM